jgi:hypothetical protein
MDRGVSVKGEKKIIGGLEVTVVSDADAEKVDYVVCMPWGPSPFDDNLKGTCCKCGAAVMYRWHAPRKPKRICINCLDGALDER